MLCFCLKGKFQGMWLLSLEMRVTHVTLLLPSSSGALPGSAPPQPETGQETQLSPQAGPTAPGLLRAGPMRESQVSGASAWLSGQVGLRKPEQSLW